MNRGEKETKEAHGEEKEKKKEKKKEKRDAG